MTWDALNVIGTIAFAVSGAIAAMEEDYDMLGVYFLALVTAFGGGAIRNVLIGLPVSALWGQGEYFILALVATTVVFILPQLWFNHVKHWMFFDAMGLAAFAIQGAKYAVDMNLPTSAVVVAAVLTGSGGGIIRDVLAGRKPLIFRDEIYGLWAMLGGLLVAKGVGDTTFEAVILYAAIVGLRMLSVVYSWTLPKRKLRSLS